MTQALDDATFRVSRYLLLQFLVNAGFGILCGLGLYLIGVPYAALWGTIAALLRIIPYVGAFAAGLLPLLLSLAVFDGWMKPLLVLSLYSSMELVTGNFLEPWLYGSHTGISSLALLLTTVFWATLWGPAGMILSTPLTVCVVVLGRHVPHLSFLHILLGDESALEPPAQFYQRMLAIDDHEARTVVDTYRSQHSTLELFDNVLIPALSMAEQDRHKGVLDSEHEQFIHLNIRDILADYADRTLEPIVPLPEINVAAAAEKGRVMCFPAHDEADEMAASMLSQLMGEAGIGTIAFPLSASFDSMLEIVKPTGKDVLCISAVPPYNLAEAKILARQLRTRCPDCRILIGTWGAKGDMDRTMKRLEPMPSTKLVYSLGAAVEYLLGDALDGKPV